MFTRYLWRLAPLLLLGMVLPFCPAPTTHAAPNVTTLTLGVSGEGRPITAVKIGDGPRKFALVGDTHGGPEANTYRLSSRLADYFSAHPEEVPAAVRLYIIPTINPDGLANGTRFNANMIDLNRNMNTNLDSCPDNDWSNHVQGAYGIESNTGGPYTDSEPESRLIASFLLDASGVIFYHSDGGDVFPAFCEYAPSIALAQAYAATTGYRYDRYWPNYNISGGMHDWASSLGIAAIIPELFNGIDDDYAQNLAGVQSLLQQPEQFLPLPEDHVEQGMRVPALIWRYWKAHGGVEQFGPPLAPAEQIDNITRQYFERAVFEWHPDQADTPYVVQLAPLGRAPNAGPAFAPATQSPDIRYFPETQHTLREAFEAYWLERNGLLLLGFPISEEFDTLAADGQRRTVQYFDRGIVAYYPEDGSVRLEPLGWEALVRANIEQNLATQQIR